MEKKLGGKKKGNGANSKRRDRKAAAYQRNLADRQKRVQTTRNVLAEQLKFVVKAFGGDSDIAMATKLKIVENEIKAEKLHRLMAGKRSRKSTITMMLGR